MCGRQGSVRGKSTSAVSLTSLIIHGGHVGEKLSGTWILSILFVQVGLENGLYFSKNIEIVVGFLML